MPHAFTFTPSLSLFETSASEEEVARVAAAFAEGGEALMPLDNYGFNRRLAWVNDR